FSSRRRHTRFSRDWSSDVCSSDLFGNPGELYTKQLDRHLDNIKHEMYLGSKGSEVDVYFGEIKTKSAYVMIQYRDYGAQDGDLRSEERRVGKEWRSTWWPSD